MYKSIKLKFNIIIIFSVCVCVCDRCEHEFLMCTACTQHVHVYDI